MSQTRILFASTLSCALLLAGLLIGSIRPAHTDGATPSRQSFGEVLAVALKPNQLYAMSDAVIAVPVGKSMFVEYVSSYITVTPGQKDARMILHIMSRGLKSGNSCHSVIDPLGFALENFDVIGGWRTIDEAGKPVDASGTTVSGTTIDGLSGLRRFLLDEPDQFPRTVTEKLLSYALGRPLEYTDRPAVRQIVRDAAAHEYRWSAIVSGIAASPPFLLKGRP